MFITANAPIIFNETKNILPKTILSVLHGTAN